jgi:hypothetical protein
MFALLRASLKHFFKVFSEEYRRARRLRVLVNLLSAVSTVLTLVSLVVTIQIRVGAWLPLLLWGALAVSLLILLMLGFIANYRYHTRVVGELNDKHQNASDAWTNERGDLEKQATSERGQKETFKERATKAESDLQSVSVQLEQEKLQHQAPDLYGKIKEVYFKPTSDGLYITLRVHIGNRGADTTMQPFVLKFLLNGREYIALAEDNVTDYSIVRTIDKPLWPSYTRETEATELTDLSEDNLKPLDHHRHRQGWLRFRIPQLVAYMRGEGGELTLEIIDAIDRVVSIKVSPPWPQDGVIRFSRALQAEWDEAVKRSQERQAKEVDSQESAPPDAS